MIYNEQNILKRIVIVVLSLALLLPSIVKFTHTLSNHEHEVCLEKNQTHFHHLDLDCDFYKFKIQNEHLSQLVDNIVFSNEVNHKIISLNYLFLSDNERLHLSLRGPPQFS